MKQNIINARVTFRKSPIHVLEKFAFKDMPNACLTFKKNSSVSECVIIQTCNRIELFATSDNHSVDEIKNTWASLTGLEDNAFRDTLEVCENRDAYEHLLKLTSGLESLVVGEEQILGQIKESISAARKVDASGKRLNKLFEMEVPEIEDGIIDITSIARQPGERAKIIVQSNDRRIDPVGACVGMRGSRIQAVVRELNNEKIDIVNHSEQPEILITRALSPAKPVNLYIDEEKEYCIAIFEDENLDSAIGRNGMNINLASSLTEYRIDAYGNAHPVDPEMKSPFAVVANF